MIKINRRVIFVDQALKAYEGGRYHSPAYIVEVHFPASVIIVERGFSGSWYATYHSRIFNVTTSASSMISRKDVLQRLRIEVTEIKSYKYSAVLRKFDD